MTPPGVQLRPDAQKLLADAWHEMIRSKSTGGFGRRIRRGWKYGEGKEIVGKTAAGVAVGAVFVGVSIATAGAATPVVIAIAAGAFAAGQVPGAAASIIKNRKGLHGITNTANWVSNMASADPDSHREHVKKLDMAAHKTLRRAYEHYRTALRKSSESEKVRARLTATKDVPCADVFELIQKTLSVSHHLYKARLYIEPAIYLQRVLLVALREWIADWARHEKALAALVTQALGPNGIDHGTCGKDCYRNAAAVKGGTAQLAALLTDADLDFYDRQLEDLFGKLAAASVAPKPAGTTDPSAMARTALLMKQATDHWRINRKGADIRIRHFVSNTFARKTKGERIAFGIGQGVGLAAAVGSTAGSVAVGPAVEALAATLPGLELGVELGAFAADTARDIGGGVVIDVLTDKAVRGPDVHAQTDLVHHAGSTATATANRESLRKAAQHIQEADERRKVVHEMKNAVLTTCAETREFAHHVYAVRHHIAKAQEYLRESLKLTLCIGEAMHHAERRWNQKLAQVHDYVTRQVARKDHSACDEYMICYGPHPTSGSTPRNPLW